MNPNEILTMDRGDGTALALRRQPGRTPTFVWLGGFMSDMEGTKAEALAGWARQTGQALLRFDYAGHGRSGGQFADQTIGAWRDDALAVIRAETDGPLVLVGSSMGAWIALLAAPLLEGRVQALLLIAPAVDFTEMLLRPRLPPEALAAIAAHGRWAQPSAYGDAPQVITRQLLDEGRAHLLMDGAVPFAGPIRILQGQIDPDVPWRHALELVEKLESRDVEITLIKDGDHRLSRPRDLALLTGLADRLSKA